MKTFNIFRLLSTLLLGTGLLIAGCADDAVNDMALSDKGYLTFELGISGATSRAETSDGSTKISPSEARYYENTFKTLDLFFYPQNATDETAALLHHRVTAISSNSVRISVSTLKALFSGNATSGVFKVIAVANCAEAATLGNVTLNALKQTTTKNDAFKAENVPPSSFVMTNFAAPTNNMTINLKGDNVKQKLTFRRVAAKIRVALSVAESITDDNGKTWTPDLKDMRLYISNGVRTARLDGAEMNLKDDSDEKESDYFNVITSGSREDEDSDYPYARPISKPDAQSKISEYDENYPYYNELPFYTYPNWWTESLIEPHQTMLTILVPWEHKEGETTTYQPTYYQIPVNNKKEIVSNAYYYIRTHIGMMGSVTPEAPLAVDMECEIADWGTAKVTDAELRPLRYLIFNQTEFVLNNQTEITIPFASTHNCKIIDFKGRFYQYCRDMGMEVAYIFTPPNTKGVEFICEYGIDNMNKTLQLTHHFFDIWNRDRGNNSGRVEESVKQFTPQPPSVVETEQTHRIFSRIDIEITVQHSSENTSVDKEYHETIYLTIYPPIYIMPELIQPGMDNGWALVNGYNSGTNLGGLQGTPNKNQAGSLFSLTLTQLSETDKQKWAIGDPRTYYMNNELDNTSMQSDTKDHTDVWNGFATSNSFWNYYKGPDWEISWGGNETWSPSTDQADRTISYYYPAAEAKDREDIIAPKIVFSSGHAQSTAIDREAARRRCASFQQYGYPAGRWRLPSRAEIEFMVNLQDWNEVVDIFDTGSGVWGAQGLFQGNSVYTTGTGLVCCVYDAWYWEQVDADGNRTEGRIPTDANMANWGTFMWGDRPKINPQDPQANPYTVERFLKRYQNMK